MKRESLKGPGIYGILCIPNKKIYIGSSKNVRSRLSEHREDLLEKDHICDDLQEDFNQFGINLFTFHRLEKTEDLKNREAYWIKYFDSTHKDRGYNKIIPGEGRDTRECANKCKNKSTPIIVIHILTKEIERFSSISELLKKYSLKRNKIQRVMKYWEIQQGSNKTYNKMIIISELIYNKSFDYINYKKKRMKKEKVRIPPKPQNERNLKRVEIKVTKIDTGEELIFQSIKEAVEALKVLKSKLVYCLNGEAKSHRGYKFEYTGNRGIPPAFRK